MLRITILEAEHGLRFQLEGRLSGPWVAEFVRSYAEARERLGGREMAVDLRGLTAADSVGRRFLVQLRQEGVRFENGSMEMAALLGLGGVSGPIRAALLLLVAAAWVAAPVRAQSVELRPAAPHAKPFLVDSNSPAYWYEGEIHVLSSAGTPMIASGPDQFSLGPARQVALSAQARLPMWIESVWLDPEGVLHGWYHHERLRVCPNSTLTVPEIGAVVSYDGGHSFQDLGIVMNSGDPPDCSAANGYFASGHGDFTVIPDRAGEYLYFLFSSYGGDVSGQGVGIARMAVADRLHPVGAVWKYFEGGWGQPGLGGRLTPIFQASAAWQGADADSFWGPSVHWNTYLQRYVVLLNRSCCEPDWPQEGVYIASATDLADPAGWSQPVKLIEGGLWYPRVMGVWFGETDSEAGQLVRLYLGNTSEWELVFRLPEAGPPPEPEPEPGPEPGPEPQPEPEPEPPPSPAPGL